MDFIVILCRTRWLCEYKIIISVYFNYILKMIKIEVWSHKNNFAALFIFILLENQLLKYPKVALISG